MLGKVYSAVVNGINADIVDVEADVSTGIPSFEITGNISATTKEAVKRVRMAIKNSGIKMNPARITVNISPANIPKDGTHFDLSVAMAILNAVNYVSTDKIKDTIFAGELSLDGKVNGVNAILPMAMEAARNGISRIILPFENMAEAGNVPGIQVIGVTTLSQCLNIICHDSDIPKTPDNNHNGEGLALEFLDVKGQQGLKRAAMIAAASMHNMLILGPPGTGKTMTAMRIPDILPELTYKESLEISKIYSISGLLNNNHSLITRRPFRNPNYLITRTAFGGGGGRPLPGEISLAQSGVLFMDEFNLFSKDVIETLREPLETGKVVITRNRGTCEYDASFMLVAAMNPCRCGYYPDRSRCRCTQMDIKRHLGKVSKPIMDRIDIFINAGRVEYDDITGHGKDIYSTAYMSAKVTEAINIQKERYSKENFYLNSHIPSSKVEYYCGTSKEAARVLRTAYDKYCLSARSYTRILKVARTIADVEEHEEIELSDLSEAIGYRWMEG